MGLDALDTPLAVADLDHLEADIARLQTCLSRHGIANWPHSKTHKRPAFAQLRPTAERGIIGGRR